MNTTPGLGPSLPNRPAENHPRDLTLEFEDRHYRIRGLHRKEANGFHVMLRCSHKGRFHDDKLELYSSRQRMVFMASAAKKLSIEPQILEKDLDELVVKLEGLRAQAEEKETAEASAKASMTEDERKEALILLRDPKLIERILEDFDRCGIVGERTNKLVGYLAAVSRKLEQPLAVVIQSSSAAGKSSLMEAILSFMPPEERVQYSAMTGQSLFYMCETDLRHKILAVTEEQGAQKATYALKLLQSEGELNIASTGKDPLTGKLETHAYHVEGPVMTFLTTTAEEIDEELQNRCLMLAVDEKREQTQAIHALQRKAQTLAGMLEKRTRDHILTVHQNAQRLLETITVVNPYAEKLTFLDDRTRTRRDHLKYLAIIQSSALLHQYQRPKKTVQHLGQEVEYIEVTAQDIVLANALCHQVLGHSLDELSPQTRMILDGITTMVTRESEARGILRKDIRLTRRQIRQELHYKDTSLRKHLNYLVTLDYLLVHPATGREPYTYELLYDGEGQDGTSFMLGLIQTSALLAHEPQEACLLAPQNDMLAPQNGLLARKKGLLAPCMHPGSTHRR